MRSRVVGESVVRHRTGGVVVNVAVANEAREERFEERFEKTHNYDDDGNDVSSMMVEVGRWRSLYTSEVGVERINKCLTSGRIASLRKGLEDECNRSKTDQSN